MPLPKPRKDAPAAVWHAIAVVSLDPSGPWTVANLAHEVGLSVRRLQEVFNQYVGVAPLHYVRELRLERARTRLLTAQPGEVTVPQVSRDVGIAHTARFAGYYRQRYGEVPSATLARPPEATFGPASRC